MLYKILPVLFVSLFASLVAADEGLSISLSGPSAVDSVKDLIVTATVKNTGSDTITILNDAHCVTFDRGTDIFTITSSAGQQPAFIGVFMAYSQEIALASGDASAVTTLGPSETVKIEHDLSQSYNFTSSGAGDYTITLKPEFKIVDPDGSTTHSLTATIESTLQTRIENTLVISPAQSLSTSKRATMPWCDDSKKAAINTAIYMADKLAKKAYVNVYNGEETKLYESWFGKLTPEREAIVLSNFYNIQSSDWNSFSYACQTEGYFFFCTPGMLAYTRRDAWGNMALCPIWFNLPLEGSGQTKPVLLIHEASHWYENGDNEDTKYGVFDCKVLAKDNPDKAVRNAESYALFAGNGGRDIKPPPTR
ncbi:hypothetical protein DL96DRAFT_879904 [Flagelloscypha sp. PMI_526]|nr:hypothetical protein DL96DRAFT_879904 [Flagelloscypha sp. PMI_526]